MRCPRCQFENMPGQERCFKCGSILEGHIAIAPPRMPAWARPFRRLSRWSRIHLPMGQAARRAIDRMETSPVSSDISWGLILGVIPGLPQYLAGEFKAIWPLWMAWLILFGLGLMCYGLPWGWVFLGLAIAVHAWMAISFRVLNELPGLGERIVVLLVVVSILSVGYIWTPRLVIPGLSCVQSNMALPHHRIQVGDYLLTRRVGTGQESIRHSMIVTFRAVDWVYRRGRGLENRGLTGTTALGQVVGLPGDTVEFRKDLLIVNGQALDRDHYPVPQWLLDRQLTVRVDSDKLFVLGVFRTWGNRDALTDQIIRQACLVERDRIVGRAFMLWWPVSRRGWLDEAG